MLIFLSTGSHITAKTLEDKYRICCSREREHFSLSIRLWQLLP